MLASGSKLGLLFLAALISASYLGMFAAIGMGMTLALLTGIFLQMPAVQPGYRPAAIICRDALHKIGSYTTSNYVSRTLLQIMPFILPMIALNVLGAEPSAYFYMAWSVGAILIVLPASIFNSLFAMASNNPGRANAETRKALKLLFTILIPAIAGLLLLADLVLELFGADYSENGANLLRIIAISVIPYSINYLHITMDRVNLASSNLIVTSAAMALLSLGLAYVFAAEWGLIGVGAGWLFGQTAVSMVSAFRLLRGPLRAGARTPPPAPQ
jgi:O-antigen/teichoic acid export membrane protein